MVARNRIVAASVPEPPPSTYANGYIVGDTIYISGQHAGEASGEIVGGDSVREQSARTLSKVQALVEAAGATMADVVKITVYLTDIGRRAEFGDARRGFFRGDFPCSTLVGISALALPGLLVEVEAIAVRGSGIPRGA